VNEPTQAPIRVAIVDDHPVVREGTAALLAGVNGLTVVGTAGSTEEAGPLLDPSRVDVVLLDIRLGSSSGLKVMASGAPARARSGAEWAGRSPSLPAMVVLTAYDYPQYVAAAMRLGAAGFVLKTAPIAELVQVIRKAAAGGVAFAVRPPRAAPTFTARELEVVRLVVEGRSNDEIAAKLGIAAKTVEAHLGRMFERLGIVSRTELATRALREGWLEVPPT
jgi:DNA-binding NarL/FixJ family response regulator